MFSAKDVKDYRERHGVGVLEARKILTRQALLMDIESAITIDEIKQILKRIVEGE